MFKIERTSSQEISHSEGDTNDFGKLCMRDNLSPDNSDLEEDLDPIALSPGTRKKVYNETIQIRFNDVPKNDEEIELSLVPYRQITRDLTLPLTNFLLVQIFHYLSTSDLLNVEQVCRKWQIASVNNNLWKVIYFKKLEQLPHELFVEYDENGIAVDMPTNAQNSKMLMMQSQVETKVAHMQQRREGLDQRVIGKNRQSRSTLALLMNPDDGFYKQCISELNKAIDMEMKTKYYSDHISSLRMQIFSSKFKHIRISMAYWFLIPISALCLSLAILTTSIKDLSPALNVSSEEWLTNGNIVDTWWCLPIALVYPFCLSMLIFFGQVMIELILDYCGRVKSTKIEFLIFGSLLCFAAGLTAFFTLLNLRLVFPYNPVLESSNAPLRMLMSNGWFVTMPLIISLFLMVILLSVSAFVSAKQEHLRLGLIGYFVFYEAGILSVFGILIAFVLLLAIKMTNEAVFGWGIVFIPLFILETFIGMAGLVPLYRAMIIYRCRRKRETFVFTFLSFAMLAIFSLLVSFEIMLSLGVQLGLSILCLLPLPLLCASLAYLHKIKSTRGSVV